MIRVDRLVVPEEKSFCSTSSVRLPHCAHSRAMATPLMPPPITRTSKLWSRAWIELLTFYFIRCFFTETTNVTSKYYSKAKLSHLEVQTCTNLGQWPTYWCWPSVRAQCRERQSRAIQWPQ